MGAFDLQESIRVAERRLGLANRSRRPRADRGQPRLAPEVLARLDELLQGQERPPVRALTSALREFCGARGFRTPARATIYHFMASLPSTPREVATLPASVRETLYNLSGDAVVPGHQLAFYCLNYGGIDAVTFAAGLPWLALYQAARLPGWRSRSKGLLAAVLRIRGI